MFSHFYGKPVSELDYWERWFDGYRLVLEMWRDEIDRRLWVVRAMKAGHSD